MSRNDHISLVALFERARFKTELDNTGQSHLESCDICRDRSSWMEVAASLGGQEPLYDPPQSVLDNVLLLGRDTSRLKQLRNAIVALLTFDSFKDLAPVGVRRSESASRQMTYESGSIEVGILLRRSAEETLTLSGQVLEKSSGPIQDPLAHVDLVVEGDHVRSSSLSPWGEFVFNELPRTQYGMQVFVLDRVLHIPSLPVIDEEGR